MVASQQARDVSVVRPIQQRREIRTGSPTQVGLGCLRGTCMSSRTVGPRNLGWCAVSRNRGWGRVEHASRQGKLNIASKLSISWCRRQLQAVFRRVERNAGMRSCDWPATPSTIARATAQLSAERRPCAPTRSITSVLPVRGRVQTRSRRFAHLHRAKKSGPSCRPPMTAGQAPNARSRISHLSSSLITDTRLTSCTCVYAMATSTRLSASPRLAAQHAPNPASFFGVLTNSPTPARPAGIPFPAACECAGRSLRMLEE